MRLWCGHFDSQETKTDLSQNPYVTRWRGVLERSYTFPLRYLYLGFSFLVFVCFPKTGSHYAALARLELRDLCLLLSPACWD